MSLSKSASEVLCNEKYLDLIFPYLSTSDLKSVRLVTPFWNKIATKFLGRKSFKPFHFSDLSRKDWVTLRREIEASRPDEDPRINLFKGFHLTWADVAIMKNCNFIALFKPTQIIISGRDSDFSPGSSTSLFTPILDTLTDVTLIIHWDILRLDFSFLENFANLGEMRLNVLHLEIFQNNKAKYQGKASILHKILSDLLARQAPTLKELVLKIKCNIKDDDVDEINTRSIFAKMGRGFSNKDESSTIKLPIFPHLTSLTLALKIKNPRMLLDNFETFDFMKKFPNLVHLDLNKLILREISAECYLDIENTLDLTKGHPLKKLILDFSETVVSRTLIRVLNKLRISFPSVEEFTAQGLSDGAEIPWVDTLKGLKIRSISREFNFVHLKQIETLHYTICEDYKVKDVKSIIDSLLNHYRQLPLLKKLHISGLKVSAQQKIQIQERLPVQFRALLTFEEYEPIDSSSDESDADI